MTFLGNYDGTRSMRLHFSDIPDSVWIQAVLSESCLSGMCHVEMTAGVSVDLWKRAHTHPGLTVTDDAQFEQQMWEQIHHFGINK